MTNLTKNNLLFTCLYTAIVTPMLFFFMGVPMILQMKGFDASLIGLFQLVGLPMVFKFLMSPPIDKYIFKKNHYKKWTFYIGIIYVLLLISISFLSIEKNTYLIFFIIFIASVVSTFIDIPLNALAIKIFKKEEQLNASSYKVIAYCLAALLGSGVFLLFFNHLGWKNTFLIMSFMVLLSLIALNFIKENEEEIIKEEKVSIKTIVTFFKQKNIGIWVFILSFYYIFISAIWVFMKPYLITKGISPDDIAIYVGIYGSIIGSLGGFVTNKIGNKFSKKNLLILFMIFNILSAVVLILMELNQLTYNYLILSITFIAFGISLSAAIIFSLIMDYSRKESRAIDYSIQASIYTFMRIVSAVIAGIIVSKSSFLIMFIFEALGMILTVFIIYKFYKKEN